jgi:hypothetical protein
MWGALSDERSLSCTTAAGPRQRSHSRVRVPYLMSDSRLLQRGRPGRRIYIPQEHGGPVTLPGTGFPFRRLLRLAKLLCGGIQTRFHAGLHVHRGFWIIRNSARTARKPHSVTITLIV